MALPLTPQQQTDFDKIGAVFSDFKAALLAAVKADNDPAHNLGDARDRANTLRAARSRLATMVSQSAQGGDFRDPDTGAQFFAREPASRGFVTTNDTPSTTS